MLLVIAEDISKGDAFQLIGIWLLLMVLVVVAFKYKDNVGRAGSFFFVAAFVIWLAVLLLMGVHIIPIRFGTF